MRSLFSDVNRRRSQASSTRIRLWTICARSPNFQPLASQSGLRANNPILFGSGYPMTSSLILRAEVIVLTGVPVYSCCFCLYLPT